MKTLSVVLIWCLGCVGVESICEAGGFFRRVPEVGEWARYEFVLLWTASSKDVNVPAPEGFEMPGSVELRCVGEETIDDVRHLWIESRIDVTGPDDGEHWIVVKILVPAERMTNDDLTEHVVRGWGHHDESELISELGSIAQLDDSYKFGILLSFPLSDETVVRRQNKTITIDGEEVQLNCNDSGALAVRKLDGMDLSGEATWWPSAEHAFGVAAVEQHLESQSNQLHIEFEIHMDLAETGTDAVSDLPEYN